MSAKTSEQVLQKVGDYDLVEKIAEGGMGTVFRGRHRASGQAVAVKVIPSHLTGNTVFLKRFQKEYEAARALDHPHVVRAIDFGAEGECPYLVMEFVEGESLGERIERDGKLPEPEAIRLISQVAQGLHKAHKLGLIHRDVKPDNILLTADGQAKLTDLGLVKEVESDLNLTRTGRGLGTPHFMAPEQFRRAKDADARCDIYSMAATLYQMVTGELPFKACGPLDAWMKKINNDHPSPRQMNRDISERVDWAIRRSMSADPAQRAGSCREFIEDLTGQCTQPMIGVPTDAVRADRWFLVYKDENDVVHTVKGTTAGIRQSLQDGLLGDALNIRIGRSREGPLEALSHRPEFRDLILGPMGLSPAALKTPTQPIPRLSSPRVPSLSHQAKVRTLTHSTTPTPTDAPMIRWGERAESPEWVKWMALMVLASATGVAGYLLMPVLAGLRFW